MPLRLLVHMGRKPEGLQIVLDNEDFFMKHTIHLLDERVNGLTKYTDGAIYVNERYFKDRFGAFVPWFDMSTGGKTILNIFIILIFVLVRRNVGKMHVRTLKI